MLKIFLYLFSIFYGAVVYIRNFLYDYNLLKSTEFDIPVISIGNITVGGTGKTPHTEYLVNLLKKHAEVATLSRGYKRKSKGFVMVETGSNVLDAGDEPLQIKRKFPEVRVAVDENRVHGIKRLLQEEVQPDVIVLDDAFQHRRVNPGINILLIDYNRPVDSDSLLPLGRLRERKYQQRRANVIIYTKCPDEITPIRRRIILKEVNIRPYQSLYFTTMEYGEPVAVFPEEAVPVPSLREKQVSSIMLSGIASPGQFRDYLSSKTSLLDELVYGDHHRYSEKDMKQIEQKYEHHKEQAPFILTTEKDAMRLSGETGLSPVVRSRLYYIPVKIKFLESEGKSFDKKIVGYVKDNRSNRKLYTGQNKRSS
ncbi:MAG: tetraacyldisaccharide 4'-kinase [Prolixibacteraceae bacterium]